jgi:hypothetical protein
MSKKLDAYFHRYMCVNSRFLFLYICINRSIVIILQVQYNSFYVTGAGESGKSTIVKQMK